MQVKSFWNRFWQGTGWSLFFFKFFLFSILAFFFWSMINIPYGTLLCETALRIERRHIPVLSADYTDERGLTVVLTLAPADKEALPLEKPETFQLDIYPNMIHLNMVPFLAIIFATPMHSFKRLALFLIIGFLLLSISHLVHLRLNIKSYYYARQTYVLDSSALSPEEQAAGAKFLSRIKILRLAQGFMEQAGSMIMPFILWIVYAQQWLFRKLLSNRNPQAIPEGKRKTTP